MSKKIFNRIAFVAGLIAIVIFIWNRAGKVKKPEAIEKIEKSLPTIIDYNVHVKPILSDKCFLCHGPDRNNGQKAGLDLSNREGAYAVLKDGRRAIVPGKLGKSELYARIITTDEEFMMPNKESHRVLSNYQKAVLIKWIEQGAVYKPHWAFIAPEKHKLPEVKNKTWVKNGIDNFVLHQLEETGLTPSPEADKETLIRRLFLDLTGLPPAVEEIDAFLADKSADAYEKIVDRLVNSPRYGEKMTLDWLDLARFADTHGYTVDRYRPMWPWRDWVIKAFNENMPYNQFVTWQIAGDLLPNATHEQKLATAFNRNHPQNMEGGIINEEFRSEYVADRTNTLGTAFLGLTISCARCHDHKFDPISQKDFYSLYSFFNNIDEAGQISFNQKQIPGPSMLLTDARQDSVISYLKNQTKEKEIELTNIEQQEKTSFEQWRNTLGSSSPFDLRKGLQAHYSFDKLVNNAFVNEVSAKDKGQVADPVTVPGISGNAFKSNGDDILKLGKVGIFNRFQPFSIGIWINIPAGTNKGVIFHKGDGDITYSFHGYYLNLREGKAEFLMSHTWPYNNILKVTEDTLPKGKWIQLTLTYSGNSKANGIKLFVDGKAVKMITEKDNLYKDILFDRKDEPGLQVGADWRGTGFKDGLVDELYVYDRELNPSEVQMLVQRSSKQPVHPGAIPAADLEQYYFSNISVSWKQKEKEWRAAIQEENKEMENIPEIMVMEEMKKTRASHILLRGAYNAPGEEVHPDVPDAILPWPKGLPKNRLGLAKWLMDPKNPLTARVAVNRYWQIYFGMGLQKTADNFGNQGSFPTHPELLDWLAVIFRESGWDVKALQKLIVLSSTYRQSSYANPELLAKDPDNSFLARGPSFRMSAEMIRDAALTASGLLCNKIGGESVKPYQPEGLWRVNSEVYVQDTGSNLYRRSMYTFWRRTNPPPSMGTFDAPLRSSCVVQRQKTSTPLQSLILLNDPQFIEACRALGARAIEKFETDTDRIQYCYRSLTGRTASAKEMSILKKLYADELKKFNSNPTTMKGWLHSGATEPKTKTPQVLAACAVAASAIMNSDAFVTLR